MIESFRMRLTACFAVLLSLLTTVSQGIADDAPLTRFEFSQAQMGVPFRMVIYAPDQDKAENVARAAFGRIKQLNDILSDYDSESELSKLSRTAGEGREVPVGPDLWNVLERSQQFSVASKGAFDITVGPYVQLWRRARRIKALPPEEVIAEAKRAVGYTNLVLNPEKKTAKLLVPGMKLDLGGIAKGYAVDEAMKVLKAAGIQSALVGGDGDILVSGPPPGRPGWRIGVVTPDDGPSGETSQHIILTNAAVSTSGDLSQRLEIDGKRYSHIVDPRTGIGLTDQGLVTIVAKDCTTSDALDTTISVMGREEGLKLIEQTAHVEARIFRKPEGIFQSFETKGFAPLLERD